MGRRRREREFTGSSVGFCCCCGDVVGVNSCIELI